jgi:hypothetical protein
VLVGLSLVVLAIAFQRLVLTKPSSATPGRACRARGYPATGALLAYGLIAILTGRTAWLPTVALCLGPLRREVERFGWASFNLSRDIALERLNPLVFPLC